MSVAERNRKVNFKLHINDLMHAVYLHLWESWLVCSAKLVCWAYSVDVAPVHMRTVLRWLVRRGCRCCRENLSLSPGWMCWYLELDVRNLSPRCHSARRAISFSVDRRSFSSSELVPMVCRVKVPPDVEYPDLCTKPPLRRKFWSSNLRGSPGISDPASVGMEREIERTWSLNANHLT